MKYLNFTKQLAAVAVVASLFAACDKAEVADPIGDRGQTIVKLTKAGHSELPSFNDFNPGLNKFAIDFVNTPTTLAVADLRRDVPNADELAKTMTVVIKDDTAALRFYNDSVLINNSLAPFVYLPNTFYTISNATPKVGGDGGTFTIVLAPGEFAKPINITIPDATVLDPSTTYALAFTIVSSDANGKVSYNNTVIATIGAKNKYDGVYDLKGIHNRPLYQFFYHDEMHMVTTGASSVIYYWPAAGSVGHPIATDANNTLSWYGPTVAPEVEFDPITNLAVAIYNTNAGGPPINKADGQNYPAPPNPLAPTISRYDDGTKTMYLYWKYNNNPDRGFFDTLVYTGPR